MRRRQRKGNRTMAEINVVPYIDVMLVLLVIFMITAPLLTQGVHINLPRTKANAINSQHKIPLIVSVDAQGRYYVNASPTPDVPVTAQQMVNLVAAEEMLAKQKHRNMPVYVKGDANVDYGKVVEAMALLQKAGASQVGLLTKSLKENS